MKFAEFKVVKKSIEIEFNNVDDDNADFGELLTVFAVTFNAYRDVDGIVIEDVEIIFTGEAIANGEDVEPDADYITAEIARLADSKTLFAACVESANYFIV